jgi:hypothetical protein
MPCGAQTYETRLVRFEQQKIENKLHFVNTSKKREKFSAAI